jgi:hypothetical protein
VETLEETSRRAKLPGLNPSPLTLRLAATNQMNDFEPISWLHDGRQPLGPGKNFKIALNGHAVRGQAKMRKQAGNTKTGWHFVRFSINHNVNS